MATRKHQFIVGIITKQIRELGYEIKSVDGQYPDMLRECLTLPPRIIHHRPDVLGVNPSGRVCIGEAKTEGDLENHRTYRQLVDFVNLELNGQLCQLVYGVPRNAEESFKKILKNTGLNWAENIHVLYIPNELINE